MKKYWKILSGVLGFCILMGTSVLLYNQLSKNYDMGQNMETATGGETGEENIGENKEEAGEKESEENFETPDFQVEDANGDFVSLSDMKGQPVVLNFWASWCPPCKSEMPDFQKAYEMYGGDIQFMMVNLTDGSRETKETAKAYIEEQGYTFSVYYDVNQEAAYAFYVSSVPATYFIDEDGNIVAAGRGMLDEEALKKGISMLDVPGGEQ